MSSSTDAFLQKELADVKKEAPSIEDVTLIAAVPALVRAEIKKTANKQLSVTCMFQPSYPEVPLVTELRSKTLGDKFLDGLSKVCDEEVKKLVGKPQALYVIRFVKTFLEENPLCICADEISTVKKLLKDERDELKLKQKNAQMVLKVYQEEYYVHMRISVPDDYYLSQIVPHIEEHNFPEALRTNMQAQSVEIARQCVQPPLKKNPKDPPFEPKPSLFPVCDFVIAFVKKYPLEVCPVCHERVLPTDPKSDRAIKGKYRMEKIYCGHLYHLLCLQKYLKTPPFAGGKMCPSCGKQIFHEKLKVSAEVMEARWAHKQAKQRELEEVVDFLE